jgi:hypothetical protein
MRLSIIFLFISVAHAVESNAIDVPEIIRRSVAATETNFREAQKYTFIEHDIVSKKDGPKSSKTYQVLFIDGSPFDKTTAIDDKPLSAGEQKAEDQEIQEEVYKREHESVQERSRRIAKYQKGQAQNQALMRDMAEAFRFRLVKEEKLDGRDVYEFEATPKPGYVPRSRETRVLLGMRGTLWVDKETCQWVKVEAQVVKSVSFYGFLAKVGPGTRFELEQEPAAGNIWLPKHFSVLVSASALGFLNENSTDDETYWNYRLMTKAIELEAMR